LYDRRKAPNLFDIQSPSAPVPATQKIVKIVLGLAASGLAFGLALVFFLEFVVDRSVRSPLEIETRLGIPLLLSIPDQTKRERMRGSRELAAKNAELISWQDGHFIRPFAEAIRDRLVLHFEQSGLVRKPKLVGLSSWAAGAGSSTVAGGLAAALSETGDGKVLLVDMNIRGGEIHPFFKGKAAASLPDALKSSDNLESAAENLYLATATSGNGEVEIIPRRFYNMIPNFKASDYDYIILDMPPLSRGSMTLAMAGFMDKMLLVVEAGKDSRGVLKRACTELVAAKANLCGVLNKVRSYGPHWLQAET
jgi:Mrp family chromosome partitioning ATPase